MLKNLQPEGSCNPHRYVPCYITEEKRFGRRCSQCGAILKGSVKAVPKVIINYIQKTPKIPVWIMDNTDGTYDVHLCMPKWRGKYQLVGVVDTINDAAPIVMRYIETYYEARA